MRPCIRTSPGEGLHTPHGGGSDEALHQDQPLRGFAYATRWPARGLHTPHGREGGLSATQTTGLRAPRRLLGLGARQTTFRGAFWAPHRPLGLGASLIG